MAKATLAAPRADTVVFQAAFLDGKGLATAKSACCTAPVRSRAAFGRDVLFIIRASVGAAATCPVGVQRTSLGLVFGVCIAGLATFITPPVRGRSANCSLEEPRCAALGAEITVTVVIWSAGTSFKGIIAARGASSAHSVRDGGAHIRLELPFWASITAACTDAIGAGTAGCRLIGSVAAWSRAFGADAISAEGALLGLV